MGWLALPGRDEIVRFARFLVVGGGLFLIDLGLFMALATGLDLSVPLSQTISVSVRTVLGFVAHKWFTFEQGLADDAARTGRQGLAYVVVGLVNIPISAAVVTGLVWLLGGWEFGGKIASEAVMALEVYALYRLFVYR